jgi:hypothetical protein
MANYTPQEIESLIQQSASHFNIDPNLFRRMLQSESGLNPSIVNQRSGAAGIAQFMPGTAKMFGIDPMDPGQAIPASAAYLRQHLNQFGGDYKSALAAYNWGPGNVQKYGLQAAPPETQGYVSKVTGGAPIANAGPGGSAAYGSAYAQGVAPIPNATPAAGGDQAPFQFIAGDPQSIPAPTQQQDDAPISDLFIIKGSRKPKPGAA